MTELAIRQLVDRLFTNGVGERADRLVLTSKEGRDLGGWCRKAIVDQIREALGAQEGQTS